MNPEKLRVAREKLTRVFRYLEALNQHRNPAKRQIREQLWSLWLHDLPDYPSIKRGTSKSASAKNKSTDSQNDDTGSGGFVLKVQRPSLTSPPEPPAAIAKWLESGWDDPSNEPSTRILQPRPVLLPQLWKDALRRFEACTFCREPVSQRAWKSTHESGAPLSREGG